MTRVQVESEANVFSEGIPAALVSLVSDSTFQELTRWWMQLAQAKA